MTSAEYPAAIWIPAHPSNYHAANRPLSAIKEVTIHITDGHADPRGTAGMFATAKWDRHPPRASSAHFIVGHETGLIIQSVLIKDVAFHAHDLNPISIAIEHSARGKGEWGPHDQGLPITPVQLASSVRLAAWLHWRCGLAPSRKTIRGHAEADPKTDHLDCPTACIDLDAYAAMVQAEYAALTGGRANADG